MSLHSKICTVVLGLLAGVQLLAGNYSVFRGGERLPSRLGYLSAIAEEDNRRIVVLLTGLEWDPSSRLLERDVLRTWEWSSFAHSEIVFESFDCAQDDASAAPGDCAKDISRLLRERFAGEGFPAFVVAGSDGTILSHRTGHSGADPAHYMDWIRSL